MDFVVGFRLSVDCEFAVDVRLVVARPHCLHVDILHVKFYMSPQCGQNESQVSISYFAYILATGVLYRIYVPCIRSRKSTTFCIERLKMLNCWIHVSS